MDENVQTVTEVEAGGADMRSFKTSDVKVATAEEMRQKENLIDELTRRCDTLREDVKTTAAQMDELAGMIRDDDFGGEYERLADWLVETFDLQIKRDYVIELTVTYTVEEPVTIEWTAAKEDEIRELIDDGDLDMMNAIIEELSTDSWLDPQIEDVTVDSIT